MSSILTANFSLYSDSEKKPSVHLVKLGAFLVALYIQRHSFFHTKYEYNYSYLKPLALTNVPEEKLGLFSLPNLPKGQFPKLEWIIKVIVALVVIVFNSYLYQNPNSTKRFAEIKNKVETKLATIESELQEIETHKILSNVVEELLLDLNAIDQELEIERQYQELPQQQSEEESWVETIKNSFHEAENKISGIIQEVFHELESLEKKSIAHLKEIIIHITKIAELADSKISSSSESTQKSPTLEDYQEQFQIINKPIIADKFQQDLIFAYLQVAGPNPLVIQQLQSTDSRLPVTVELYSQIAKIFGVTDSLTSALHDGRLYIADYSLLNSLVNGSFISKDLEQQKYIAPTVALFAVPPAGSQSRSLFPVAISYPENSISSKWTLFTPLDGESWMTAKNIVQMTDSNYHELVSHLGRTHLVVEPFIVPTYNLPENHPLRTILIPHLEGTLLINYGAHAMLVAPEGTVDSLLASSIGNDQSLSAKGTQSYLLNFNEISFPQTLANRGVTDPNQLPTYPYRDDGLLIWNAIESWVRDYFSIYYHDDSSVQKDRDLQNWASTLVDWKGGRLQNFGDNGKGAIQTRDYLVKAVSTLIFTASAQHAAVNFSQEGLMIYTPAFPFARYIPAPTNPKDSDSFIKGLPSLSQAKHQLNMLYLLGSVNYTKIGKYSPSAFPENPQLPDALTKFHANLQAAETIINDRNRHPDRLIPYEFLLPSRIPQSINI